MLSQEDQPVEPLVSCSFDQLTMFGSWQSEGHNLGGPILEYRSTERRLVHICRDAIPPSGSEPVKFIVRRRCISICIALEIRKADMHDDVNSPELGQSLKKVER